MALTPRKDDPNRTSALKDKQLNPHKWADVKSVITQSIDIANKTRQRLTDKKKK